MHSEPNSNALPAAGELVTSLQFIPLPTGIYSFTVQQGSGEDLAAGEILLPAVQVGVAPKQAEGLVEFISRSGTIDRWLACSRDMIIARISGGGASLLLTSVRTPSSPVLGIRVRKLGADLFNASEESATEPSAVTPDGMKSMRLVAHIHKIGDVLFDDGWAGGMGDRLWIEAFSLTSIGPLSSDAVEYSAITADGFQTPWLSNGMLCGSRGRGIPLLGCAIRLRSEAAEKYLFTYTCHFVSGKVVGPIGNGDLCCSETPMDPLWGIELHMIDRKPSTSTEPDGDAHLAQVAQL